MRDEESGMTCAPCVRIFAEYAVEMSHDGVYADHLIIQCLANVLQIDITIIQSTGPNIIITAVPHSRHHFNLAVGYLPCEQHYVSVVN